MLIIIMPFIFSISICLPSNHYEIPYQGDVDGQINAQFPGNYTQRQIIYTKEANYNILLSPDQNWIVYQSSDQRSSYSTTLYFRKRNSLESKSFVVGVRKLDDIISWAFNKKGDLLFVGTFYGSIYMCRFWENMTNEDCETKFETNIMVSEYSISINAANQVAICLQYEVRVLKLTETGELIQVARQIGDNFMRCQDIKWHPKLPEMVIIGYCNQISRRDGRIGFFNVSSNQSEADRPAECVKKMVVFESMEVIIIRNYFFNLNAYTYDQNGIIEIGISKDIKATYLQLSKNQVLLGTPGSGVYYVLTKSEVLAQGHQSRQNQQNQTSSITAIVLAQVYSLNFSTLDSLVFSQDGNQYISCQFPINKITVSSMCPSRTYYTLKGCSDCDSNCSTCHFNSSICTNCLNHTFALLNSTCLSCSVYLPGCLTCSNHQNCLSCNYINNWYPLPKNGSCFCQDFYFMLQNRCKPCDSSGACRICKSQTECIQCDLNKGYKLKPVDSMCICRRQFSSVNNTCIECDIEGCERCDKVNACVYCSQENGYESAVTAEGICIKNDSISMMIVYMIFSAIGGCFVLGILIYVIWKCKSKKQLKMQSGLLDKEQSHRQSSQIDREENQREKREPVPKFEEFEEKLRESIGRQVGIKAPIRAIDRKEYAKISDEQKIRFRRLLRSSLLSNQ